MAPPPIGPTPRHARYDVVIVGGAMMGSATAWFLADNPDFDGRVLVVERDPSYENSATARTNSCIRQQYSAEINIRISQFGADYVKNFRAYMGGDPDVPPVPLQSFGYLYLAADERFAAVLRANQTTQAACGAGTRLMTPDRILADYPFYNLADIVLGSHNTRDEGYFEGSTLFDWWRRVARRRGVEYVTNEVVAIERTGDRIAGVTLASGERVACGWLVNAAGTRGARTAAMAGIHIPIEPRKRFSFVFAAEDRLPRALPLTIDPSGVHMRSDGANYLCGCPPDDDRAVDFDDFAVDSGVWEDKVWPALAHRVPAFERVKLLNAWMGHYDYNTLDQNAIVGPHDEVRNFLFLNGFSGHGLQQSPAMGRGTAEWIAHGEFRSLDLSPLGYERIARGEPFRERAII
ncbi:MAG: FAD-binding oxidoreductase [Alphaproteobacteria bacterium]|nr:FAD-binding oxidoreductase [Alphaproteobacteria bacterium]MCB9929170.1 FAD-binding oxidoreductase [Alphaproteobacteria bacterium]